jgi:hypothetical protein
MGILANHVPSVEALKAGVVEVIEDAGSQSKKWFSKSKPNLDRLGREKGLGGRSMSGCWRRIRRRNTWTYCLDSMKQWVSSEGLARLQAGQKGL